MCIVACQILKMLLVSMQAAKIQKKQFPEIIEIKGIEFLSQTQIPITLNPDGVNL